MKTIPLSKGYVALVDDEDFERVSAFKWFVRIKKGKYFSRVYARRQVKIDGKCRDVMMHSFILGVIGVDHKNHNGLDNQRRNLRKATEGQNQQNGRQEGGSLSPYRGVFKGWGNKWRVRIRVNGKRIEVGSFADEVDAATAYNFAAYEHHGEFAIFNTPISSDQPKM